MAHIDGPLHWTQLGRRGHPMLFVHPNPMDQSCWLYQMAHFSTWFRTLGIDLPGYGFSPKVQPGLTMIDLAEACWDAADATSKDPAILVGLSVGAAVVMRMASLRPERTLAVVLTGTGYQPGKAFTVKRIAQYEAQGVAFRRQHTFEDFSPAFRDTPMAQYFADLFTERNASADAGSIIEMFRAHGQPDPDELFQGIQAPTLIITGSEDATHQAAFELQKRIPSCELVTLDGAGHACNLEQPWAWDAHCLRFLRTHGLLKNEPQGGEPDFGP